MKGTLSERLNVSAASGKLVITLCPVSPTVLMKQHLLRFMDVFFNISTFLPICNYGRHDNTLNMINNWIKLNRQTNHTNIPIL